MVLPAFTVTLASSVITLYAGLMSFRALQSTNPSNFFFNLYTLFIAIPNL